MFSICFPNTDRDLLLKQAIKNLVDDHLNTKIPLSRQKKDSVKTVITKVFASC
jgi:hypothetical protein